MIDDHCDYCRREFGRQPEHPAICPTCGRESHREPERQVNVIQTSGSKPAAKPAKPAKKKKR